MFMRNVLFSLVSACMLFTVANAKEARYRYSNISPELLKNAHAVIRLSEIAYAITGPDEYTVTETIAVTVLDEKGVGMGNMAEWYTKARVLQDVSGTLFDNNGEEMKTVRKKDIEDRAAFGGSFVDDIRVRLHSFNTRNFPYTTEYEIVSKYYSTMHLGNWKPVSKYHCSLEQASLSVEYPASLPLRYRSFKLPVKPEVVDRDGKKILTIKVSNQKAIKEGDELSVDSAEEFSHLMLATDTFSLFDNPGSMATWNEFGRFVYRLNENRDQLTPEMKATVHKLTDTCKTDISKISALYQYLQKNTRYVSIQLGVGGWQTFEATFVSEKKYGDCKALSNFMKAMLRECGITGCLTLAESARIGGRRMIDDFPYPVFNHMILCLPAVGDTTWLECTSHDLPVGYLSSATSNRNVLLLTPGGGVTVCTPVYGVESNTLSRKATLKLAANDVMLGNIRQSCRGLFWEREHHLVVDADKSTIEKHFNSCFGFTNYRMISNTVQNDARIGIPVISENVEVEASAEITRAGKNMIVSCGALALPPIAATRSESSTEPFQLHSSYAITDTLSIDLGGNFSPVGSFNNVTINYPFGSYKVNYELIDAKTLLKTSVFTQLAGVYTAEDYKNYRKLHSESSSPSKNKVVLVGN